MCDWTDEQINKQTDHKIIHTSLTLNKVVSMLVSKTRRNREENHDPFNSIIRFSSYVTLWLSLAQLIYCQNTACSGVWLADTGENPWRVELIYHQEGPRSWCIYPELVSLCLHPSIVMLFGTLHLCPVKEIEGNVFMCLFSRCIINLFYFVWRRYIVLFINSWTHM